MATSKSAAKKTPKAPAKAARKAPAKAPAKAAPKPRAKAVPDDPRLANVQALGTLLTSSYGKPALTIVDEDGPVFGVVRKGLPKGVKEQWEGEILELWVGLDADEDVFAAAFVDFETKGVEAEKLAVVLAGVSREMGMCYGSFGSLDGKHVSFVVGLPGSSVEAVPGAMLAETIAYALNGAATAKEHLDRLAPAAPAKAAKGANAPKAAKRK